ncbi:MAG: DUF2336 domain-containing protein [Pseudomonadota bacterium]
MVIEYFMEWVQTAPVGKRIDAAAALARACTKKGIEPEERDEIEAALTVLLEDNAPAVRLAIAEAFGAFASAPRHVITTLANDNPDISVIVLSQSPVFHDAELINLVRRGSEENQIAISCRPWLSEDVVSAICHYGCRDATLGLLMNSAARFNQNDLHFIAQRHGTETDIRLILTDRDDIAVETRHVLLGKLGEALGGLVKKKAWLPEDRINTAIGEAFDKASIIFAAKTKDEDVTTVVRNLMQQNRLTVSFLVRAICMGNITLVASAFSELSGVRFSRVEAILTNNRESAFKAVYDRAGLPKSAFIVFQTALATWRRLLTSGSKLNQARLPFIVTREVLEAYAGKSDSLVDELLVLLRKLSAETARESSRAKAQEITERKIETVQRLSEQETEALKAVESQTQEISDVEIAEIVAESSIAANDTADFVDFEIIPDEDMKIFSDGMLHVPAVKAA